MSEATKSLQSTIIDACADHVIDEIQLPKGDYALGMIEIPKNCKVSISSKDKVRLLYVGKRNRPMFLLGENSTLVLREKIEIYYNTNNIREVMRLMFKVPQSGKLEISPNVKISLFSQKVE